MKPALLIVLSMCVLLACASCDPHDRSVGGCHADTECMQMHGGDGGPQS